MIYLKSKTCTIESNLDTPVNLRDGEDHYLTLLNLNFSNVFANTSTTKNKIYYSYYKTGEGEINIEETLPQNRIMTLEEIYDWAGKASTFEGDQMFKFVIDTQTGKGKLEAVDNIEELFANHNLQYVNINQGNQDTSFFSSDFFYNLNSHVWTMDRGYGRGPGWTGPEEQRYTRREPSISTFNQLFVTTPLVQNTGRTVVNGNCLAVPMIAAVSSAAEPFEYVQYTAFQPMKCKLSNVNFSNLQFTLKTENNVTPEVVDGADVEFSVLIKIE